MTAQRRRRRFFRPPILLLRVRPRSEFTAASSHQPATAPFMCARARLSVCVRLQPCCQRVTAPKKKKKTDRFEVALLSLPPSSIHHLRCTKVQGISFQRRRPSQKQCLFNSHAAPRASTEWDQRRWQCTFTSTSQRKGSETQIKVEVQKILWHLQSQSQRRRRGRKFDPIG